MNNETVAECMRLSFGDTPFRVVVEKLAGAGVAAYADLIALRKTYYDAGADSADEPMPPTGPP